MIQFSIGLISGSGFIYFLFKRAVRKHNEELDMVIHIKNEKRLIRSKIKNMDKTIYVFGGSEGAESSEELEGEGRTHYALNGFL